MARAARKANTSSLRERLSKSLSRAKAKVARLRKRATPAASKKSPPRPAVKVTTPRRGRATRPKLSPSQRGPRKPPRVTSARPTVGAPTVPPVAPSVAPPLTSTAPPPEMAPRMTVTAAPATLPRRYGQTVLVLTVRDPWWLYAYWEVTSARASEVQRRMPPQDLARYATVVRCYDVTDCHGDISRAHRLLDAVLTHDEDNWFIDTGAAHRTWVAELGYRTATGTFHALVRSNVVTTPRAGPSEEFDAAWMSTDEEYWKLLGVVYGLGFGTSSFEIRQLLERRFREVIYSARGSVSVHPPALTR